MKMNVIQAICLAVAFSFVSRAETVNVMNLGAVGDGKADDWVPIQKALSQGGGDDILTVVVPDGTYLVSKPLSIFSNTTLQLSDNATIMVDDSSVFGVLRAQHRMSSGENCPMDCTCTHGGYSQIQNVRVVGGTFEHRGANGGDAYVIQLQHGSDITLENTSCKGNVRHHFNCSGSEKVVVRNVTFLPSSVNPYVVPTDELELADMRLREAIHVDFISAGSELAYPIDDTPCRDVIVTGCTFDRVIAGVGTHRHHNEDGETDQVPVLAERIVVTNCTFKSILSYAGAMYGFSNSSFVDNRVVCNPVIEHAPGVRVNGVGSVRVIGNHISGSASHGIIVESESNEQLTVCIERNVVKSSGVRGISVSGSHVKADVNDNMVQGTSSHGIFAYDGATVTADGNTLLDIGDCAVVAVGGGTKVNLSDSTISRVGVDGFRAQYDAEFSVTDTTFDGVGQHGVLAQYGVNAAIRGCRFDSPEKAGVFLDTTGVSLVESNDFICAGGFTYATIYAIGSDSQAEKSLLILGNKISSSQSNGIYVKFSHGVDIVGNTISGTVNGGIYYNASSAGLICSNTVENAGTFGILVAGEENALASAKVTANFASTSDTSTSADVNVGAYAEDCALSGNFCGNNGVYISSSAKNVVYHPADAWIESISISSEDTADIIWTNNTGVTGYFVEYSPYEDFPASETLRSGDVCDGSGKCGLSGLSSSAVWYVRVRVYHIYRAIRYESCGDSAFVKRLNMSGIPDNIYYSVCFDANGGDGQMLEQEGFVYGMPNKLAANEFVFPGYVFSGWAYNPASSLADYEDGASLIYPDPMPEKGGRMTLYAVWTRDETTYTVHFDGNGATAGIMADQLGFVPKMRGRSLDLNRFTRTGYEFLGWAKYPKSEEPIWADGEDLLSSTESGSVLTLYAVWKLKDGASYSINFNPNGGVGAMADKTDCIPGVAFMLPQNKFTNTGYIFQGWALNADASNATYIDCDMFVKDMKPGSTLTLYAIWKLNTSTTYTVRFDGNGATSGKMPDQTGFVTGKGGRTLDVNTFVNVGYDFLGWAKYPKSTTPLWTDGAVLNTSTAAGETLTLYAVWRLDETITYSVAYEANGGRGSMPLHPGFVYGKGRALRPNAFTRDGYVFKGWNRSMNAISPTYKDGAVVYRPDPKVEVGKTLRLFAIWERDPLSKKISFDSNGGTGVMEDQLGFLPDEPKRLAENAFVRPGYVFSGWAQNSEAEDADYVDGSDLIVDESKTLYAIWTVDPKCYTVSFDPNGGNGTMDDQLGFVTGKGGRDIRYNSFTRTGFKFLGWAKYPKSTNPLWADGATLVTQTEPGTTLTLYAVWGEAADTYSISFDPNGGEGEMPMVQGVPFGDEAVLPASTFTRDGYDFLGWSENPKEDSPSYVDCGTVVRTRQKDETLPETITLYAIWREHIGYRIEFHKNEGSDDTAVMSLMPNEIGQLPWVDKGNGLGWARRGFKFKGWSTTANSSQIVFDDGDCVQGIANEGEIVHLYAVWVLKPGYYAVMFVRNDGAGTCRTVAFPYGIKTRMPSLTNGLGWPRRGYAFKGWELTTKNANDNARPSAWKGDWAYIATPVKAGETLLVYARWELKKGYYQIRFNKNDGSGKWRTLGFEVGVTTRLSTITALGWERGSYKMLGWASNKANSESGKVWKGDGSWVKNAIAEGRTLSIYAVWEETSSGVGKQDLGSVPSVAAVEKSQDYERFLKTDASDLLYVSGEFQDGTGVYYMVLDNNTLHGHFVGDIEGMSVIFRCEAEKLCDCLQVTTEDGSVFIILADGIAMPFDCKWNIAEIEYCR